MRQAGPIGRTLRGRGGRQEAAAPPRSGASRRRAGILATLLALAIMTGVGLHGLGAAGAGLWTASAGAILVGLIAACALGAMLIGRARPDGEANRVWGRTISRREGQRTIQAVEAARLGVFDWLLEENAVRVSASMAALLRLEGVAAEGEIAGEALIDRFATDFRLRLRAALAQAALDGELDVAVPLARLADGTPLWIGLRGRGERREPSGRFARITGVAVDLSRERLAGLRAAETEARLREAIEAVRDAFVLFDRSGALVQCNDTFRRLFAIEPRVVKPGARRQYVLQFVRLALRGGAAEGADLDGEMQLEDGRWLAIAERRTSDGGWVMTASDVTALKTQEEARRQNEEKLSALVRTLEASRREAADLARDHQAEKLRAEAANEAKSTFLANMSHELRTPLNAINGFSEMMVEEMFGPLGDKRYAQYAADILASGEHLLALINDVLDLAKVEAGKMRLHLEPVGLDEVARDAVRVVRRQATAAGSTLDVELEHLPPVEVDYRAIKQVLLNLLSNAIRFTPRGGRIRLWAEPASAGASAAVRVHVSDTGPGIAPEELGRLMQPFEQSSAGERGGPGTGLGLAVCRSLIELHGGALELESALGEGFTAHFTLPLAHPERVHEEAA